jgi:hypothetical protein
MNPNPFAPELDHSAGGKPPGPQDPPGGDPAESRALLHKVPA